MHVHRARAYLDVHIAYRQARLKAIEYLEKFGYTGAQAYVILGTAPVQVTCPRKSGLGGMLVRGSFWNQETSQDASETIHFRTDNQQAK